MADVRIIQLPDGVYAAEDLEGELVVACPIGEFRPRMKYPPCETLDREIIIDLLIASREILGLPPKEYGR